MGIESVGGISNAALFNAPQGAGVLLPEAGGGNATSSPGSGNETALPPGADKVLRDGIEGAQAAAEGNFVPGLLSLTQSTFQQVRMTGQMAESACKDTQPGEDKKASNNPTGM